MASRSEKLRRRAHRKEKKRKRSSPPPLPVLYETDDCAVVASPPGGKLSEMLLELIAPELPEQPDDASLRKLLNLAMIAWNVSLVPSAERAELLDDVAKKLPDEYRDDVYEIVEVYIDRKLQLYPRVTRPIVGFELTWLPSGEPYVMVVSGL
jgi:hypothetical protein